MSEPSRPEGSRYLDAATRYTVERDREARRSRRLSWARLAVFLASAAAVLSIFPELAPGWPARAAAGAAGFVGFGILVYWHSRVEQRERWFASLARVNTEAAARVARQWDALPPSDVPGPGADHPFADDLDIFGHASVFQLLGWVATEPGRATLSGWLTVAASPREVRERQAAVSELAGRLEAREEFAALGRMVESERVSLDGLLEWADRGPWFTRRRWRPVAVLLLAGLQLGLLTAHIAGIVAQPLWVYPMAVTLALFVAFGARTMQTFTRVFTRAGALQRHAELFRQISDARFTAPYLVALQAELRVSGATAAGEIARLATLSQFADLRHVGIFHPLVTLLTLWDFHVLAALEAWQRRAAPRLRDWYAALGRFDAISALAALAHDNPSWPFPEIDESARRLDAGQLGHPLIREDRRVANDVRVGPPGRFLMVTGSNMSGKSTLLRAVGVNVVLAQAGGPVCAASMRLPPLALATSMRVQDSLEEGVSYFMAAVRRLALVVEAARRVPDGGPMLLYLLDEVLQGTNTAERQVAVRRIVHHLLGLPVIGMITTHDLELAAGEELSGACDPVHFSEGVEHHGEGIRLTFDYRLKPGIATSRNALKLLQIVGLDTGALD